MSSRPRYSRSICCFRPGYAAKFFPRALLLGVLVSGALLPNIAAAERPAARADQDVEPGQISAIHFKTPLNIEGKESGAPAKVLSDLQLEIAPDAAPQEEEGRWEVVIRGADEAAVFRDSFPDWATAPHYDYQVQVEVLAQGHPVVLLSTVEKQGAEIPPDAPSFQRAWIIDGQKWRRAASAQSSLLDGGARLELRALDGEVSLTRTQAQTGSIFCGADQAMGERQAFVEVFEPDSAEFTNRVDVDALLSDAVLLESEVADDNFNPPYLQAWSQWFAASSDRQSREAPGAKLRPLELGDRKFDTAWMEGAAGLGRGEFVSTQINDAVGLSSVRIVPGIGGSEERFEAFARPTRVLLSLSDGSRFIVPIERVDLENVNQGHGVLVRLPEPVKTRCMTVMLLEATPGVAQRDEPVWAPETVAIAQITPYSSLQFGDAKQTAARIVARILDEPDPRLRQRIAQMALTLRTPMTEELRDAAADATPEERERLLALVGSLSRSDATPLLIGYFKSSEPGAPEYRTIKRSIAAIGRHAAPDLLAYIEEDSITAEDKRVDALRLFGRIAGPEELQQLIPHLGRGTSAVRRERIRAIAAGGRALVEPLLSHAHQNIDLVGGYDAIQTLNMLGRRLHHRGQGELDNPELYWELLASAPHRRIQLRLLEIARYFSVPGFVDEISPEYLTHQDSLVREAAISALERYPDERARQLLAERLLDDSPDARLAAILALDARADTDHAVDQVLQYIQKERWPTGLGRAFRLLASTQEPRAHRALEDMLREAPTSHTALLAARELTRARTKIDAQLAIEIAENTSAPPAIRLQMLDLLGLDDSAGGEEFLLEKLRADNWAEFSSLPREQLSARQRVYMSLGRRRSAPALQELLNAVIDGEDPQAQKIALRALAFYKDRPLLEALNAWKTRAPAELQSALEQSITMIERRLALDSMEETLGDVADDLGTDK